MKFQNSSEYGSKPGALASLPRKRGGGVPVALAAIGLAIAPSPVSAQSSPAVATPEEALVCLTMQRTIEDLRGVTEKGSDWAKNNRNNSRYSDKEFNRRVAENNGKLEFLRGYIASYNQMCARYVTQVLADICTTNSGLLAYIHPTDACRKYRREAGN